MNALPVANAMLVLTTMMATVSTSNPDTGRPVARRHDNAVTIQTRPTIIAVARLKSTSVVAKSAAGAITAVTRLTATRVTMQRTWGGAGRAAAIGVGAASWITVTPAPYPG